jgi:hypothetical protein
MERLTFAGIEKKIHPMYRSFLNGVYDNREIIDEKDAEILQDIVEIYHNYIRDMAPAGGEWNWIQENRQKDFRKILTEGNVEDLLLMYRNLFRNQISFGISAPDSEADRNQLVNDTLLDIDTWKEFCKNMPVSCLKTPEIGNPFGILVEGTLVMYNSCRHYYHADKLRDLSENKERPVIFEIGAGYGGVFYFLTRMRGCFCYIVCDLMETLLTNYYYTKKWITSSGSDIEIKWALDGRLSKEDTDRYQLILVPSGSHSNINIGFDIAYNANSFSEMSYEDINGYFDTIERNKPEFIFHQNSNFRLWEISSREHTEVMAKDFPIPKDYKMIYQAVSPWTGGGGRYREYLYKDKGRG